LFIESISFFIGFARTGVGEWQWLGYPTEPSRKKIDYINVKKKEKKF